MYLQLLPPDRYGRVSVEKRDDDDTLLSVDSSNYRSDSHYRKSARILGVDKTALMAAVDGFRRDPNATRVPLESIQDRGVTVMVRGRIEPAEKGQTFADKDPLKAFTAALAHQTTASEPLITWDSLDSLAALDVDVTTPLSDSEVANLATLLEPRPAIYWRTHHGGLRLIYAATGDYPAGDLAAVASLALRLQLPTARMEIKHDTRHPGYRHPDGTSCGPVVSQTQTADVSILNRSVQIRSSPEIDVSEWCESRGLQVGQRYTHSQCPIDPVDEHGPDTRPVQVAEAGVHCYRCEAKGLTKGSRKPGWFPFAPLGKPVSGAFAQCLRHFTHWGHARYVVENTFNLPEREARFAYSAALRLEHGPKDPRIPAVFTAGKDLVRLDRRWATASGETYRSASGGIRPMLEELPACRTPEGEVIRSTVARMEQAIDLWEYGYPALSPVWSISLHGEYLDNASESTRVPIVLFPGYLAPEPVSVARPRYREIGQRMSEDAAWRLLEEVMPGLPRQAVIALIAAKGAAESGLAMPPFVFLTGPTGAGKTSVVQLAAAIAGDEATCIPWVEDRDRLRAAVLTAKEQGSYCLFDEVVKNGNEMGRRGVKALDFVLTLTPESVSHKLYVGPIRMGTLPVVVFADTGIPYDVKSDAQLARRLTHIHIAGRKEWKESMAALGVPVPRLRLAGEKYVVACDAILSSVIDTYFREPLTFEQIAKRLGFASLERSDESELQEDELRDFFAALCEVEDTAPVGRSDKPAARGWKRIERGIESPLARAWGAIADPEDWCRSRRAEAADWKKVCGLNYHCEFEVTAKGQNRINVRLIHRGGEGFYRFNKELLP